MNPETSDLKPEISNLKAQSSDDRRLAGSIGNFAELVASDTPTPGGGSVAADCGVLAAALGRMMCNLTIGKAKYAEVEPRLKEIRSELERLGARLSELIAEDAASFEQVMAAYRLPKQTDDEKAERKKHIEAAGRLAAYTPLETATRAIEVLKLLDELKATGNQNALPDITVGAQLAGVAVKGASYNVFANLGMFSDSVEAERLRVQMNSLIETAKKISEEIESYTLEQMS